MEVSEHGHPSCKSFIRMLLMIIIGSKTVFEENQYANVAESQCRRASLKVDLHEYYRANTPRQYCAGVLTEVLILGIEIIKKRRRYINFLPRI